MPKKKKGLSELIGKVPPQAGGLGQGPFAGTPRSIPLTLPQRPFGPLSTPIDPSISLKPRNPDERRYEPGTQTNVTTNPRRDLKFKEYTKADESGDVFRYHEYNIKGKRRVFRVGGPVNRKLH